MSELPGLGLAIALVHPPQISAVYARPWGQWGIKAVRVYPLRSADVAAQYKLFGLTAVAHVAGPLGRR